jgi:hypothetical protein
LDLTCFFFNSLDTVTFTKDVSGRHVSRYLYGFKNLGQTDNT